jgi:hypothetical protein
MRGVGAMMVAAALAMPGLAVAQSNPVTGMGAGQVHGQRPDMRQDLHNAPGAPAAANQPNSPRPPQSRTEVIRQRSATAQSQQVRQQAQRRAPQRQNQATAGQEARLRRTGTGTAGGRSADTMAAHEARMSDARRRQAAAEEAAARAFPGVR